MDPDAGGWQQAASTTDPYGRPPPQIPAGGRHVVLEPPEVAPKGRRRVIASVIGGVVLLIGVVVGAATIGFQQGKRAMGPELESVNARLSEVQSERRVLAASAAAAQSESVELAREAAAVPDLKAIADQVFGSEPAVDGSSDELEITLTDGNAARLGPLLSVYLTKLGFSAAVLDRMGKTRALDGTQSAEGKNCNATWTYHPDDGLQIVFEAKGM